MKVFVRRFGLIVLLALFVISSALAIPTKYVAEKATIANEDTPFVIGATGAIHSANLDDLDEQVGDTLTVGTTYRDMQHNGVIGRMIAYEPEASIGGYSGPMVHVAWCYREGPETSSLMRYTKILFDEDNNPVVDRFNMNNQNVSIRDWSAYGSLCLDPNNYNSYFENNPPLVCYHGPASGNEYQSYVSPEASFVAYFFTPETPIPNFNASLVSIWPHLSLGSYEGMTYAHILTNPQEGANEDELYYHRMSFDGDRFYNVTPGGATAIQVSDEAMNLAGITAVSPDGSHVVVGQTISRWLQRGSIPASWEGYATSQSDNDVYIWESEDGGETWDWNNPVNVTNFTQANPSFLPGDTTSANQDSMRAYTEVELKYDSENNLHLAFNAHYFDYYRGYTGRYARIYYWNDVDQQFSMIADGDFFKGGEVAAWERMVCHANLELDEDNDVIWAMWQQYGEPTDTLIRNDTLYYTDISDGTGPNNWPYVNAEIFVSASFDGGKRWMKGINVTNTKFDGWDAQPGECRSEREPSFAIGGGYLHIFYTLDLDAGIAVPANSDAEGEGTNNPQVYHRIAMSELADSMWTNAEYLPNYPVHFDENDGSWYQDANDWAWDAPVNPYISSIDQSGETLTPDQFELKQNYPNPFNPSTQIAFDLKSQGSVKLAVFDVLGREVVTLVNRTMEAGSHKVTFLADELPSGVYFYKLTSGNASQVRKMVLMK